jgi:protein-disulfide isomerase
MLGGLSSRLEQKAAARAAREEKQAAERKAMQRRRSLIRLGVVAAAALAVVAGVIFVSRANEEPQPIATPALFAGIPQEGIALGSPSAPATLVEFADLQCPFCGQFGRDVVPTLVEDYVRTGKLRMELQVLTFLGEDSVRAGEFAAGAAAQNRLWPFADAFYAQQGTENSGYVTDEFLDEVGRTGGVDVDAARGADTSTLNAARDEAERLGVDSTPSFFLRKGDGELERLDVSELTPEAFTEALDKALQ